MVETGLNRHDLGKLILAACFITDLGTVLALGGMFASYGWPLLVFAALSAALRRMSRSAIRLSIRTPSTPAPAARSVRISAAMATSRGE